MNKRDVVDWSRDHTQDDIVTVKLTILGNSGDFVDEATNTGPAWEHILMLRDPNTETLVINELATPTNAFMPGRQYIDTGLIYRLARSLRQAHVMLAQSEQSGYQAMLALAASFRKRPLFIIFHGHEWSSKRNRTFGKLAARLPWVQILCLSSALRTLVIQEYGFNPARVHATGYGVDEQYFKPDLAVRGECIVSAGTASRDYRTLVEASRHLDVPIRIAADSTWYREKLNVTDDQVPKNVEIFSAGGYPQLRKLYSSALFVVIPLLDVRYACGYAVMAEAMAMGKAVIATRTGSPSDLIEDGLSGLYVPPHDVAAMQAAMQRLLSDPQLALDMGRQGRKLVEERFTLKAYVARLRDAITPALVAS